uniref:Uncharacterized protein MANES_02G172200 n=1 Tax=Rhizophora mucronata TaxID=61149 RepID=A0A2P2JRB0_RHIMU
MPRYPGGWESSTNSGAGDTNVSSAGPINNGGVTLLTSLFKITRCTTLLYLPFVKISRKSATLQAIQSGLMFTLSHWPLCSNCRPPLVFWVTRVKRPVSLCST